MLVNRTFGAVALALVATFSSGGARAADGGTVVIATTQQARHFNGAVQSGVATALPNSQLFASPLRYDENWTPQPYLATSWSVSADGLSVTLNLARNALFHDGQPVTSADVAFSIMAIKTNHPFKSMLAAVEKVDTPDPGTAVIRLTHPQPSLLLSMSPALMPILPKHVYGDGQDLKAHPANLKPIGSGPFKLTENVKGEHYTLEKFDRFFMEGRPKLDKIVVRLISDPNAAIVSFERGDTDMLPFASGVRDIERLRKAPNAEVVSKGFAGVGALNWLAFNTRKKPLDDVRVRHAIAYGINRDLIVKAMMGGVAKVSTGPIASDSPYFEPKVEQYKYDPVKAAKLLDDAGYKAGAGGSRFTLAIDFLPGGDEQQRNVAEFIRSQLKKIGITVDLRTASDFPTWAQRIATYDFDMTMDQVFNWGDPVIGVDRTYLTSNIVKGVIWSNTQQYSNPKVDELLTAAAKETVVEKRKVLYSQFQKIVVDDAPIYYIDEVPYRNVFNKNLTGLPTSIWGVMSPLDELRWASNPRK